MKPAAVFAVCILVFSSCHRYYLPAHVQQNAKEDILQYKDQQKTFVLRDSIFVYDLSNIVWQEKALVASLRRVSRFKEVHNKRKSRTNYYYSPGRPDSIVTNQVHIVTAYALTHGIEPEATIPFSSIARIEELKFDKQKTARNRIAAGLAVGTGVGVVLLAIQGLREMSSLIILNDY